MTVTTDVPAPAAVLEAATDQRIQAIDVLRGFAILGMFIVHFHFYANDFHDLPGNARTAVEDVISWIAYLFIETKSHATFTFLFGVGFAIQLRRAGVRGAPFVSAFLRRLGVLALFGFVAHACFGYNVLLSYAYAGLFLILVRNWPPRALAAAAIACAMLPNAYYVGRFAYDVRTIGEERANAADEAAWERIQERARSVRSQLDAAEAQTSYAVTVRARLRHMRWFYAQPFFLVPGTTLCLFLLGMLALRCGVLEEPRRWVRVIVGFTVFGAVAWASAIWLIPFWQQKIGATSLAALASGVGLIKEQWLAFTYIGGLLLLVAARPEWLRRLAPLGWIGRMALTNYLLQIAVLDVLFAGYGLHLTIRERMVLPATVLLFGAQIAFSRFWLGRFRYGPMEWLWRFLTYGTASPTKSLPS